MYKRDALVAVISAVLIGITIADAARITAPQGTSGGGGGAPTDAEYWTGAAHGDLSAEHNLGALSTGLVVNTAGVPAAYAGDSCDPGDAVSAIDSVGAVTCFTPSGGGAPTDATYWVGAAHAGLSAEINLGALSTGLVLNTGGTPSAYAGTSCTNQFARSLNASGVATCATVDTTDIASNAITTAKVTDGNITYAKIQNVTDARLLGRSSGSAGPPIEITVGSGLSLSGGALTATGSGGGPTRIRLSGDVTTTSSSLVDITGLTFSAAASTAYIINCSYGLVSSNNANGAFLSINGPASPTSVDVNIFTTDSGNNFLSAVIRAYDGGAAFATGSTTEKMANVRALIVNGSNTGNITLRFASEIATTQSMTVKAGSFCTYQVAS